MYMYCANGISAIYYHTCGLMSDSSLVCFGDNTYGETTVPAPNSGFGIPGCRKSYILPNA